ncbi:MAG TPA: hypothetical protein VMN60_06145 [Longimicrobiales bacterium]|nr:hypothetical protein [Longimicrobiales bacterium]
MKSITTAALLCVLGAAPCMAQEWFPNLYTSVQGLYGSPRGEFSTHVDRGWGLDLNLHAPVTAELPLALRMDVGFVTYGRHVQNVCFDTKVECGRELDLTTTNSIQYIDAGVQLMLPWGPVRPYASLVGGVSYFTTNTTAEAMRLGQSFGSNQTDHSDLTVGWKSGGGVLIRLLGGHAPLFLDLSAHYHANGMAEYVTEEDVSATSDGNIVISPRRGETNLWAFQIGLALGILPEYGR